MVLMFLSVVLFIFFFSAAFYLVLILPFSSKGTWEDFFGGTFFWVLGVMLYLWLLGERVKTIITFIFEAFGSFFRGTKSLFVSIPSIYYLTILGLIIFAFFIHWINSRDVLGSIRRRMESRDLKREIKERDKKSKIENEKLNERAIKDKISNSLEELNNYCLSISRNDKPSEMQDFIRQAVIGLPRLGTLCSDIKDKILVKGVKDEIGSNIERINSMIKTTNDPEVKYNLKDLKSRLVKLKKRI